MKFVFNNRFTHSFRMLNQNEDIEIILVNEQSSEAQATATPHETLEKQRNKEKKKGVFRSEWLSEFKFLKEYKSDKSQVTCMACNDQFSVHYGGKSDVVQHSKSKQHIKNMLAFSIDRQLITTAMRSSREKDEIAAAEATLVYHGVQHGMAYLAQQCTTNVLKTLFASSSLARSLSCAKTKAAAIATEVLAPYFTNHVLEEIKSAHFFSLSFDASNKGSLKMYPFCVQYFSDVGVKKGNDVKLFL
jgi:hypothetical protein